MQKRNLQKYFFSLTKKLEKFKPPQIIKNQNQPKYYPVQHPKNLDSQNSQIVLHDKPLKFLTPRYEYPPDIYIPDKLKLGEIEQPNNPKILEIALVGPTNSGKSSLLNSLINFKVSAVSPKSQTTYEEILGIHTRENVQLLIYDTPGITKRYKYSKHFVTKTWEILDSVQKCAFVIDAVKSVDDSMREGLKRLNQIKIEEESLSNKIKIEEQSTIPLPKILVINKMDLCLNKKKLNYIIQDLEDNAKFDQKFFVSCNTGYGVQELLSYLESEAIEGEWKRHKQLKCDLSKAEIIEQIVKQSIFDRFYQELPYTTGAQIIEFSLRSDGVIYLCAAIDVENLNQKKIFTGYDGRNIFELKSVIKVELAKLFKREFEINIKIKIRKDKLEVENQKFDQVTQENYGNIQVKKAIDKYDQFKKEIAEQVENILSKPNI